MSKTEQKVKPVTAWAVVDKDGEILAVSLKGHEGFTNEDWGRVERMGYRLVKVNITEAGR